ncbi:hypothetical protein L1987_51571 [Smallanthus sonchifolius]|uniref:Uncharacterized protein n=1 Tax=Smallanthus sonchifolius TaxID=185202 RepID=A0ACB9EQR2_9ASTR|nr:hypothetical protein L1987_51571 [Smallanthus sonchifolius]
MEDKVISPETVIQTGSMASVSDFVEQEESSIMDSQENESSKWTNEKHSLYLQSIEASFVDQLYNTLDMLRCQARNTNCSDAISTRKNHRNECIPSSQFKVLHRGRWSKRSFKRENSHLKDADRPHVSPCNPWIQHFGNGSHKRLGSTATSLQYPVPDSQLDQEPGCSITEVMDQNFVEDTSCSRKRVRASKIGHSSNDRIVPYFTSAATEMPGSYVFPKE